MKTIHFSLFFFVAACGASPAEETSSTRAADTAPATIDVGNVVLTGAFRDAWVHYGTKNGTYAYDNALNLLGYPLDNAAHTESRNGGTGSYWTFERIELNTGDGCSSPFACMSLSGKSDAQRYFDDDFHAGFAALDDPRIAPRGIDVFLADVDSHLGATEMEKSFANWYLANGGLEVWGYPISPLEVSEQWWDQSWKSEVPYVVWTEHSKLRYTGDPNPLYTWQAEALGSKKKAAQQTPPNPDEGKPTKAKDQECQGTDGDRLRDKIRRLLKLAKYALPYAAQQALAQAIGATSVSPYGGTETTRDGAFESIHTNYQTSRGAFAGSITASKYKDCDDPDDNGFAKTKTAYAVRAKKGQSRWYVGVDTNPNTGSVDRPR